MCAFICNALDGGKLKYYSCLYKWYTSIIFLTFNANKIANKSGMSNPIHGHMAIYLSLACTKCTKNAVMYLLTEPEMLFMFRSVVRKLNDYQFLFST